MNTVIHCCQYCAESYCLLCVHELGYCLTCEADLEVSNVMDPLLCPTEVDKANVFPDQSPIKTSNSCLPAVSQPPPQCESNTSHKCADSITSEDAAVASHLVQSDNPSSQSNLTTLQQLHRCIHSLIVHVRNFECLLKATNVTIRDV